MVQNLCFEESTDDDGDNRRFNLKALLDRRRNCLGLSAGLGLNTGESAGCVNKTNNRHIKLVCQVHKALRFAIAFGLGHSEIIFDAGFNIVALFLSEHNDRNIFETADTSDHRLIIGKTAITGQRCKIFNKSLYII